MDGCLGPHTAPATIVKYVIGLIYMLYLDFCYTSWLLFVVLSNLTCILQMEFIERMTMNFLFFFVNKMFFNK